MIKEQLVLKEKINMKHILKCELCNSYTLKSTCKCTGSAKSPKPAKYSPEDKYGKYRREVKEKNWHEQGLL